MSQRDQEIRLEAFDLVRPIGRGGMAEVWAGRHRSTGEEVAVKILTDEATRRHEWIVAFRNEIRAVAGLTHPAIVHVDDFGEIPPWLEGVDQRFRPGCPYLVMERVTGGSLRRRLGQLSWQEIRFILIRLLDALAHAHARGLVHRDITPGNILGSGAVIKLTDFGLVHWLAKPGGQKDRATTAGTPAYMAPEQWLGRWRDFGPWTDLYGVGCLAWALATGAPPFGVGGDLEGLRASHLQDGPPPFDPTCPVPSGFEDLIRRCLRKDPALRIPRAADLMWRLLELQDPTSDKLRRISQDELATQNIEAVGTRWSVVLPRSDAPDLIVADPLARTQPMGGVMPETDRLRVPRSWRGPSPVRKQRLLPGVGLGLLGFRTVPLVGREREQNALWQALLEVAESNHPRAVVLRGPAGAGKSRLAQWLAERSHEVGAANALRADHDLSLGGTDPLIEMLRAWFRVSRSDDEEALVARLRRHLRAHGVEEAYELAALKQLLLPRIANDSRGAAVALGTTTPAERRAGARRALARLGQHRPLVLWLEDVQWGADSIRFAREILDSRVPLPAVVVLTVRDDVLADRPEERGLLDRLKDHWACTEIQVGPLERRHWRELVRGILLLEEDLAVRVEERAAGNPLFAIQLIADWVQRGQLELGERGFRLLDDDQRSLPDDIHQVWADRVQDLLAALPATDSDALSMAAVLGDRVDSPEWTAACRNLGVEPSPDLLERLLAERLARIVGNPDDAHWAFAHGMLRESLLRQLRERGRDRSFHGACARMLTERGGPAAAERVGRHLVAAGDLEGALRPLLDGAAERADLGDFREAEALVSAREDVLDELDIDRDDPRWGEGMVLVAGLEVERHRLDRAAELAGRLQVQAEAAGWSGIDGWSRHLLGRIACLRGDLHHARQHLEAATELAQERVDNPLYAACRAGMGMVQLLEGRLGSARAATEEAQREFTLTGLRHGSAAMTLQLSLIALQEGMTDVAAKHVEEARFRFEDLGARNSVAQCATQQGAISRARGDDTEARRYFEQALATYDSLGAGGYLAPLIKLAVTCVDGGEFEEARGMLTRAMVGLERIGSWGSMGVLQVLALPSVAAAADWDEWDRLIADAEVSLRSSGIVDDDVPRLAALGARLAARSGETERARRAFLLALSQWRRLGYLEKARDLATEVAELA